jgi:hypothetical protein
VRSWKKDDEYFSTDCSLAKIHSRDQETMAIDTVTDTTPTGKMDIQDSYNIVRGEQREIQR